MLDDVESTMGKVFSGLESPTICWAAEKFIQHVKKNGNSSMNKPIGWSMPIPDFQKLLRGWYREQLNGYPILIQKSTGLFLRAKEET